MSWRWNSCLRLTRFCLITSEINIKSAVIPLTLFVSQCGRGGPFSFLFHLSFLFSSCASQTWNSLNPFLQIIPAHYTSCACHLSFDTFFKWCFKWLIKKKKKNHPAALKKKKRKEKGRLVVSRWSDTNTVWHILNPKGHEWSEDPEKRGLLQTLTVTWRDVRAKWERERETQGASVSFSRGANRVGRRKSTESRATNTTRWPLTHSLSWSRQVSHSVAGADDAALLGLSAESAKRWRPWQGKRASAPSPARPLSGAEGPDSAVASLGKLTLICLILHMTYSNNTSALWKWGRAAAAEERLLPCQPTVGVVGINLYDDGGGGGGSRVKLKQKGVQLKAVGERTQFESDLEA